MWLTIYYKSWHSQRNQTQVHGGLSNWIIVWVGQFQMQFQIFQIAQNISNISNISKYFKYFKIYFKYFKIFQNISKFSNFKHYPRYTAVCQPHKYNMREKSSCARLNLRTLKYRKCLISLSNYLTVYHKNYAFFLALCDVLLTYYWFLIGIFFLLPFSAL